MLKDLLNKNKEHDPSLMQRLYSAEVTRLLRQKYSLSAELAIIRQKEEKPEEFAEYYRYAEECKQTAKAKLGM